MKKQNNTLRALIDAEWECDCNGYSYTEHAIDEEIFVEFLNTVFDNGEYALNDEHDDKLISSSFSGNVSGTPVTIDVVFGKGFLRVSDETMRDCVMDVANRILERYKTDENVARDNDIPERTIAIKAGNDSVRILGRYIDDTIYNIRTYIDVCGSNVYMGGKESVYVAEEDEAKPVYDSIKKATAVGEVDSDSDEFEDCLEKLDMVGYPPSHIYWWSEDANTAKRFYICFDCDSQI